MTERLKSHFFYRVRAAYKDYLVVKETAPMGSMKHIAAATEATIALYHLREHLPASLAKSRKQVEHDCSDYTLLRDVADADKHCELDDKTRAVSSASQIKEILVSTAYRDDQGPYRHVEREVWLELRDGTSRDLLEVLTNVMNYWMDVLRSCA